MAMKSRVLYLLRYLFSYTDDDHPVSIADLKEELNRSGFNVTDTRTIRNDIETIREAGFDIVSSEKSGTSTLYSFGTRTPEKEELRILIDAVTSAAFVSREKTEQLIDRLVQIGGEINRNRLQAGVSEPIVSKTRGQQTFYTVQAIMDGIYEKKRICFLYGHAGYYGSGERFIVSPYGTLWHENRYYMVGYCESRKQIRAFRLDRMEVPEIMDDHITPMPEGATVHDLFEQVLHIDRSNLWKVKLRCSPRAGEAAMDHFGDSLTLREATDLYTDVSVYTEAGSEFFAWIFGQGNLVQITGPDKIRQMYGELLAEALHTVKGTDSDH